MKNEVENLVAAIVGEYSASGVYSRAAVDALARFTLSEDPQVAESATRAFFTGLVEPLADSFEPADVTLYNHVFAQVIQICRADSRARGLDSELGAFGLKSEDDLIARAEALRQESPLYGWRDWGKKLRRVIVLSRVTLGADVAITSVIMNRLKHCLPVPQVLIGSAKLQELFGGDPQLTFKEVNYARSGTIIERLLAWIDLLARVREATADLDAAEFLIFDPDTRLTQLGLVPVAQEGSAEEARSDYLFFPSREYGGSGSQSLGELASMWLNRVFDQEIRTYPYVSLRSDDEEAARNLAKLLRRNNSRRPIVTMNFGVGENPAKRVGDEFERSLVLSMLQHGAIVILDKGASSEEMIRANKIAFGTGVRVVELNQHHLANLPDQLDSDLVTWGGRIGLLAAFIGQSDLYIGYDSAGQHIAAALGVPCIDVFTGFSSHRFLERWRPTGTAEARVISVDPSLGAGELADRVTQNAIEMLQRKGVKC